jgi:hypothetical protein
MKKLLSALTLILVMFLVTGCPKSAPSSSQQEAQKTEQLMQEMNASVGMPSITNYQEKRWAKMIFELRDKSDLVTYAYIVNLNGDLVYLGKCIGYGLPYSVQYTAPQKAVDVGRNRYAWMSLPQADPNGLYMPEGLSATWLMMEDPNSGEIKPVYVEQEILVSPFKFN